MESENRSTVLNKNYAVPVTIVIGEVRQNLFILILKFVYLFFVCLESQRIVI